ncbi:MAG TPA: CHAP domain-containing protein [Ktedonobacterales bacterium]
MRQPISRSNGSCLTWRTLPLLGVLLTALALHLISPVYVAYAAPLAPAAAPGASCAQLARVDRTATNGPQWGVTILAGHGAPGGWFGVPVCANGVNSAAPGGANVSCDRIPYNYDLSGCAPGGATSDGYGLSFQCVELVARFAAWAFHVTPSSWRGDAPFLWLNGNHPEAYVQYPQGGAHAPVAGDVLVWGTRDWQGRPWPAGPAGGHVAVVAAVGRGWVTFVEENMLGRGGNIPAETTSLGERNGRWTIGPTYATNGGRSLYGWLHLARNDGRISGPSLTPSAATPSTQNAALPSLADGVIVTGAGSLAEAVWSDTRSPLRPSHKTAANGQAPYALAESLGAPPGVALNAQQTPALVTLPGAARYAFAIGADGQLYAVYIGGSPSGAAVAPLWQSLGAPAGVSLAGSASAVWDGERLFVGALGSDGAIWARSGPPGMLGDWTPLGRMVKGVAPVFTSAPAIVREPGASAGAGPTWSALAIGQDGALYEAAGQAPGASEPSAWSPVVIPGLSAPLVGRIVIVSEPAPAARTAKTVSAPTLAAVDAVVSDTSGTIWILRRAAAGAPWRSRSIAAPDIGATLMAASLTSSSASQPALQLYVSDPSVSQAPRPNTAADGTPPAPNLVGALTGVAALSGAGATRWTLIGYASSDAAAAVVALNVGSPALALSTGTRVTLLGADAALRALAPQAPSTSAATATGQTASNSVAPMPGAGSAPLGNIPATTLFNDPFTGTALDSHWLVNSGAGATVVVSASSLALTAPARGSLDVWQGAPSRAFSFSVRVTPGAGGAFTGRAGIALALDDWNSLTVSVGPAGRLSLCPTAGGVAEPCQTSASVAQAGQDIFLRVSVREATVTAETSLDNTAWSPQANWTVTWAPGPSGAAVGAFAPPLAAAGANVSPGGYFAVPLLFTRVGLFVDGGASANFSAQAITASNPYLQLKSRVAGLAA